MAPHRRYRCRFCGRVLNAWPPVPKRPNGAMLLAHLSHQHPAEVEYYLDQMCGSEDIGQVATEAFEVVEEETR
jgi:hypothetical protein